jgi:hypothetical protein
VVIIDLMQWVKIITDKMNIPTAQHMVEYLVRRCLEFLTPEVQFLVICWDRSSPEVKKLVCHANRYRNISVLHPDEGPHLPNNVNVQLHEIGLASKDWLRFSASGDNLRRELGPRLVNAFNHPVLVKKLLPGQQIILNGFPVKFKSVTVYENPDPNDYSISQWGEFNKRQIPIVWNIDTSDDGYGDLPITAAMEQEEPRLYNRVVAIHKAQTGELTMQERPDMENDVAEGDAAIFWVDHFFPHLDQMLVINDGDAILIGLLYARERMHGNSFRNVQTLCMKYLKKTPQEGESKL